MVALVLVAQPAHADDDLPAAQIHFDAAREAFLAAGRAEALGDKERALSHYRRAVEEFKHSYEAAAKPITLYALGETYRALGEMELALAAYRQYLVETPVATKTKHRGEAERKAEQLEKAIAAKQAAQTVEPRTIPTEAPPTYVFVQETPPKPIPWYRHPAAWTLATAGLGALAIGAGLAGAAPGLEADAQNAGSLQARADLERRATDFRTAGWSLLGAGAGCVAAAAVVFTIVGVRAKKAAAVALGGGGLVLGRF
jgi:tetratricopeptide (TPR) repeat protein